MTLNVLLLEDDPAKKGLLLKFLEKNKGNLFERIDTVLSVSEALNLLKDVAYDLLIMDVVVPRVLGGIPHERNAIELLQQIDDGRDLIRPEFIVAISASSTLSQEAHEFFVGRPWGILNYSESDTECLTTIEKIAKYIFDLRSTKPPERKCDVFLLTALMEPEFSSLESTPGIEWGPPEPLDRIQFVRFGELEIEGNRYVVAMGYAPRMGPVAAATLVAKAVMLLRPRLIVMCGICAGIAGKASIGDVIAAEVSWDWQSGKFVDKAGEEKFEIGPHQVAIDEQTRSQLMRFKRDSKFWESLSKDALSASHALPKLVIGPMATGSSVLGDARVSARIAEQQHRSLVGLDMETYGVYLASITCDSNLHFLSLKAVCDFGDKRKNDDFQKYASCISAKAAMHFLANYVGELIADK